MKRLDLAILPTVALAFLCVTLGIWAYVPERTIKAGFADIFDTARFVALTVTVLAGVAAGLVLIIGLGWLTWVASQHALMLWSKRQIKRAKALKKMRQAKVEMIVAPAGSQVYPVMIDDALNVLVNPAHLAATTIAGYLPEPTAQQFTRWLSFQQNQSINRKGKQVIEENLLQIAAPLPDHIDLGDYVGGETSIRNIFLGMGKFPDGQVKPVRAPLSRLVHIAVAGASGFGKSFCEQSLAYQIVNARENVQIVMLDAQGVTFTPFEGDKRLMFPLASEPSEIRLILTELVKIMSHRKNLFSEWRGVQNLEQYNKVAAEPLPVMPILFDEFGIVASDKVIAGNVEVLSQGARKFGVYIIAGAQTWYSDRIASSLKANLSTAVQFYANSKSQSRVLIGDSAAAEITRPGQAFCRLPGQAGLIELQAPDVSHVLDIEPMRIDRPVIEPEEDEDDVFVRLVEEGMSRSQASMEAYGKPYSGKHVTRCRQVLGEI